jgi:hypothetical protein
MHGTARQGWQAAIVGVGLGCGLALATGLPGERATAGGPEGLASYATATFPIATEAVYEVPGRASRTVTLEGIGTVLFERYVLTVAHAVSRARLEEGIQAAVRRRVLPPATRFREESTWLLLPSGRARLAPVARDDRVDVALFELPAAMRPPALPCSIGDSDSLRLGAPVLLVERDLLAGPLVRPAAVAALKGSRRTASLAPIDQSFIVTLGLAAGESGSPLLLSGQGSCDLVGLAQGTYVGPRQLAWGIRIREALEALAAAGDSDELAGFLAAVCEGAARPGAFSFCDAT